MISFSFLFNVFSRIIFEDFIIKRFLKSKLYTKWMLILLIQALPSAYLLNTCSPWERFKLILQWKCCKNANDIHVNWQPCCVVSKLCDQSYFHMKQIICPCIVQFSVLFSSFCRLLGLLHNWCYTKGSRLGCRRRHGPKAYQHHHGSNSGNHILL